MKIATAQTCTVWKCYDHNENISTLDTFNSHEWLVWIAHYLSIAVTWSLWILCVVMTMFTVDRFYCT